MAHSTFINGLERVLERMARSDQIKTITPGRIEKISTNHSSKLLLRVDSIQQDRHGGKSAKLIARNESLIQEVSQSQRSIFHCTHSHTRTHTICSIHYLRMRADLCPS
eukprot:scaffold474_cov169-Ochromonas_danica.AAC.19